MSADETVRLVLVEKYAVMMMSMLVITAACSLVVVTPTEASMTPPPPSAAGEGRCRGRWDPEKHIKARI